MEYTRNCPTCNKILTYTQKYSVQKANKINSICKKCTKKHKWSLEFNCVSCDIKLLFKRSQKIDSLHQCRSCQNKGENNPFYKKEHTEEAKQLNSISHKGKLKGKDNPMYGKPSPQGTGWGWSGWYKGWYFRSLLELSYMIKVIEKEKLIWESAETKKFMIPYVNSDGYERTYFPDFLVAGNRLIEIKPRRLHKSVAVLLKKQVAEKYCLEKGWNYEILDPKKLTNKELISLYDNGDIKFLPKYEKKWGEKHESLLR